VTCETCQPNRGWWHKLGQKCRKCGGWPMPADERMAMHSTGDGYYTDPERDMTVRDFVNCRHGKLMAFAQHISREMNRVGHASYTEAEWIEQFNEWEKSRG
jgi:hypothetical protein